MHASAQVRRIRDHVRGPDTVTGRPCAAGDPALLLWVHGALVDSVLAAGSLVGTALSAADSDRGAPALDQADVRLRRTTRPDARPPDRNPAVTRTCDPPV